MRISDLSSDVCSSDLPLGRKIVIPGIYVLGDKPPKRKFPNYPLKFTKAAIEEFAKSHLGVAGEIRDQRDAEFKNLAHDLRAIGTEIYHSSLSAKLIAERSEEHTSELQSLMRISYAVF